MFRDQFLKQQELNDECLQRPWLLAGKVEQMIRDSEEIKLRCKEVQFIIECKLKDIINEADILRKISI